EDVIAGKQPADEVVDRKAESESDEAGDRAEEDLRPASAARRRRRQARSGWQRLGCRERIRVGRERRGRARAGLVARSELVQFVEGKEGGCARSLAHMRRSPIRNSSARSRRMCGSDRLSPSAVCSSFGGRKRKKRSGEGSPVAPFSKAVSGWSGRSPGNKAT